MNSRLLEAVDLALAGQWDAAHGIVQQFETDTTAAEGGAGSCIAGHGRALTARREKARKETAARVRPRVTQ